MNNERGVRGFSSITNKSYEVCSYELSEVRKITRDFSMHISIESQRYIQDGVLRSNLSLSVERYNQQLISEFVAHIKTKQEIINAIKVEQKSILDMLAVGGTISGLTGGKFANGAISAAFAQMFNGEDGAALAREKEGLNISKQEQLYLDIGTKDSIRLFYKSRISRGDKYAQLALDVVNSQGSLGNAANAQLALEVLTNNSGVVGSYADYMESVNVGLARAHGTSVKSDFINDTTGVRGLLNKYQIQQYHEIYFSSIGVSPSTFGGATTIPFIGAINNDFLTGWCNGCDTNY